jgi:hypothetical protein
MRLTFDDYILDVARRELWHGSEPITVEPQVFDLLVYLAQKPDRVVSSALALAGNRSAMVTGGRDDLGSEIDSSTGQRSAPGDRCAPLYRSRRQRR